MKKILPSLGVLLAGAGVAMFSAVSFGCETIHIDSDVLLRRPSFGIFRYKSLSMSTHWMGNPFETTHNSNLKVPVVETCAVMDELPSDAQTILAQVSAGLTILMGSLLALISARDVSVLTHSKLGTALFLTSLCSFVAIVSHMSSSDGICHTMVEKSVRESHGPCQNGRWCFFHEWEHEYHKEHHEENPYVVWRDGVNCKLGSHVWISLASTVFLMLAGFIFTALDDGVSIAKQAVTTQEVSNVLTDSKPPELTSSDNESED